MSDIKDGESHLSGGRSSSMNHDVSQQIYDNLYRLGNRYRDKRRKPLTNPNDDHIFKQFCSRSLPSLNKNALRWSAFLFNMISDIYSIIFLARQR